MVSSTRQPQNAVIRNLSGSPGDLAAANLTVTPERLAKVDFGRPWFSDVREIVVTGPASPPLEELTDLSGQRVVVHPASSYASSLEALSRRLAKERLPRVKIDPARNCVAKFD